MPETTPANRRRLAALFGLRISAFRISICDRPEAERVQTKFRARAHGENVANDSAYAGGRALERLDRARVIVALHLERDRPAVADIDHAGVFLAGFDQNVRARSVGNFFSSFREFLYEQCSLHMTEKIPSSVKFGSRPRIFLIRSNSSRRQAVLASRVQV